VSLLKAVKKLILGDTWILPASLCAAIAVTLVARELLGEHWRHAGGFVLLATVAAALVVSVQRSARAR